MSSNIDLTFRVLARSANATATEVLVHALDVRERDVRDRSLRAILSRRDPVGHLEALRRWRGFDERSRKMIGDRPGRISGAIREAILSKDRSLYFSGCDAAIRTREYDLMPALSNAAEDRENAHAEVAAKTLLALATMLDEEIAAPRDYENRFDPQLISQYVLGGLEQSVLRFGQHGRSEIIEAFLLLARSDNETIRRILLDELDACHLMVTDCLLHSPRRGVLRLLVEYLSDPSAPPVALRAISHRKDLDFVRQLFRTIGPTPAPVVQHHLRHMESFRWLAEAESLLPELTDSEQQSALAIALGSTGSRSVVFTIVRYLVFHGHPEAKRAAAKAIEGFRGFEANQVVYDALHCEDPEVQAILTRQLRDRGITGAMSRLIELLDSEHRQVREAARGSLGEYNFQRYLSTFDLLDDDIRRTTGLLVKKVDEHALVSLTKELRAPVRARRVRALEAASAMSAVAEVEEIVHELLFEPDQYVRAIAARVLGRCDTKKTRRALRQALLDANASVREEAENSLQAMTDESPLRPPSELGSGSEGMESPVKESVL